MTAIINQHRHLFNKLLQDYNITFEVTLIKFTMK